MSTASTQPHPIAAWADLPSLSGPWLMAEDRVRAFKARVRSLPASRPAAYADDGETSSCPTPDPVSGYSVSRGIARIDVCGILTKYPMPEAWMDEWCGTCPTLPMIETLNRAMSDWTVRGVVWVIDCPGGMVAGTNLLAEAIAAANRTKPQVAVVSDLAASGGYYLASQCRSIACNAMGETGCIGVYSVLTDDSEFWKSLGVTFHTVSSGGVKGLGADGKVTQELIDDQKRGLMGMYDKFVADVAAGRGMSIEQARQLGDGRCWIAPEALKLGLIDSVAPVGEAVAAATMEVQRMNAEQFKAYAAANPDDAAVKALVDSGYQKARAEFAPKAATAQELDAAFPGEQAFCFEQLKANATLAAAATAYGAKLRADLAAKDKALTDQAAAHKAESDRLGKELAQAKFEASGQRPVGTGNAKAGTTADNAASDADLPIEKQAEADYDADPKAQAEFEKAYGGDKTRAKAAYVKYRINTAAGRVRTARQPA